MIMAARTIMEQCKDVVDDNESQPSLDKFQSVVMEPCFIPGVVNNKKRKQQYICMNILHDLMFSSTTLSICHFAS
ncbi:hypothetical protein PS15m_011553 [Mucor circinelloides]